MSEAGRWQAQKLGEALAHERIMALCVCVAEDWRYCAEPMIGARRSTEKQQQPCVLGRGELGNDFEQFLLG